MGLWTWIKSKFSKKRPDPPMVSLVFLLAEPREMVAEDVAEAARNALGVEIVASQGESSADNPLEEEPDPHADPNFVVGSAPAMIARINGRTFLINCFPGPYVQDAEAAAEAIPELRLRQAVASHKGWLSVDLLREGDGDDSNLAAVYRVIGKLLAEFARDADDVLAIVDPATNRINAFDPSLLDRLASDDPRSAVEVAANVPVVPIAADDPRLVAAVAEARERWPEFVRAFEERQSNQMFSVKAEIVDGNDHEFMWLQVTALEGDRIYGILDNDPIQVRNVRLGGRVRVSVSALNDWIYTVGDTRHGGFTIDVLRDRHSNS